MSDSFRNRLAANLKQVKATGSRRASSIKEILKDATLQTINELKEGGSELSKTAKDSLSSTINQRKNRDELDLVDLVDTNEYPDPQSRLDFLSLLKKIKDQSSPEQLRERLASLDANLTARYGQRYEEISQKRRDIIDWYNKTLSTAEITGSNLVQDQHDSLDKKSREAGTFIARKEQKVKQYLRAILKNIEPKS